ncbi:pentatricopeptide repeat-containing protein At1g01970 [Telopea speciosissima]|uniref:pentatricopeptide repeat-containing protein At1g01970 n=1 Tax=Telopea speciosissima TaxID=54955 RepID=UPI001CC69019|nr:pentatricopeptide repeat-containing protein At1g01970 [Telopea speciosissima]XP_043715382.1 pentatricopeptide repeat-containing protein At1g01970 [Telopea speciosissima]
MSFSGCYMQSYSYPVKPLICVIWRTHHDPPWRVSFPWKPRTLKPVKSPIRTTVVTINGIETEEDGDLKEERPRLKWVEVGHSATEEQKQAISQLPRKMTKRCKALMRQIMCLSSQEKNLSQLLDAWVRIMRPRRADWLSVLKELKRMEHPLLFEVTELALPQESFEANVRDYTKIIDGYGKQNRLQDAENALLAMKNRGLSCDQVTLTVLIHMYNKAGDLKQAEATFEEIKLLGVPVDKRAYGSMIMAYVRAGMTMQGENLLREMEVQEIYAGKEVFKALLRAYSMVGDTKGAQRVFDAIQLAGMTPDVKLCALLINAYVVAGQSDDARSVFENLRSAGLEPSDKCVALMLAAYAKENRLKKAMDLLIDLERDGVIIGKEASEILAGWFRRLGVVGEVEFVLRDYSKLDVNKLPSSFLRA